MKPSTDALHLLHTFSLYFSIGNVPWRKYFIWINQNVWGPRSLIHFMMPS